MFRKLLVLAALAAPLAACDAADPADMVAADSYQDGTAKTTERGAFDVTLWTEAGEMVVGENTVYVRVSFPDMDGAVGEGPGIPNADINVDAWMHNENRAMGSEISIDFVGDGQYRIDGVRLDHAGAWQFDFNIAVGETVQEDVSFAFIVE